MFPWSQAFVINRKDRPERLEQFSKNAIQQGINFSVWPAQITPLGAIGCMQSHREILTAFQESGQECWAIFEDDCVFVDDFEMKFARFFSEVPIGWDVLWLGGRHVIPPIPISPNVTRIMDVRRSHAYIASFRSIKTLLATRSSGPPGTSHVDQKFSTALASRGLTYAPTEWLCGQSSGFSDIMKSDLPERWQ